MSKVSQIKLSSTKKGSNVGGCSQISPRFTWHPAKTEARHLKHQQPLRFFGNNPFSQHYSSGRTFKTVGMVKWENTFNMRPQNLNNFPCGANYRATYRSQAVAMQRARAGFISGTSQSLDLLRQNLQKSINKEIDEILQKYLQKFFKLAVRNIRKNNGENAVSEQHMQTVCRQILEEAKKMYQDSCASGNGSSTDFAEMENIVPDLKGGRCIPKTLLKRCKDSDTDSEASLSTLKQKKKKGRPPLHQGIPSGRSTPMKFKAELIKREGPKWDPARLSPEMEFIMGAKANKALGLGATRGRLYIKHPDIFKYSGDQEDKQWLYDHNLMPATGGKAYMLLVEDIKELAESDEYRNSPSLMLNEIVGFTIPDTMRQKMKSVMQQMRTDVPVRKRGRPPTSSVENSNECVGIKVEDTSVSMHSDRHADSGTVTPTDELDLISTDIPSTDPSPYGLGTGFEDDVSPVQTGISPAPSDMSGTPEPPLTAPFDVNTP